MIAFRVTIGPRQSPRLSFEAMSESSCACAAQHADLCLPNERMSVESLADVAERSNDRRALERQINAQLRDPLLKGIYS